MKKSIKRYLISLIMILIPETSCFKLKAYLYRQIGFKIGKNVRICSSAKLIGSGKLIIGDNTWIGPNCIIAASSKVEIGDNVDIAPLVYIGTGTHELFDQHKRRVAGKGKNLDVKIGDGCWIGVRSTILPGVKISKMTMVAAGSLVNKEFDEFKLIGGIPAKEIKDLK